MYNLNIDFSYWWLLFLIIPAVVLTLIPYFRLSKKYRKTRNRITSIVLHIIIMVLAISVLSGMVFTYQLNNDENEVIFLVDVSDTQETSQYQRDEFVRTALDSCKYSGFKVGIVTFGFDQKYVVSLTKDVGGIYNQYINSNQMPDKTASNIAAALLYTKGLFEFPKTAKIVLVSDGKETDETASSVIRSIAAQGTRVDTAFISADREGNEIQLIGAILPNTAITTGQPFPIKLELISSVTARVDAEMYVNDELNTTHGKVSGEVLAGYNTIEFQHTFPELGLYKIVFRVTSGSDTIADNNVYTTYINLTKHNRLLILESVQGESDALVELFTEEGVYNVALRNVYDSTNIPDTIVELCNYDQVILNNISNADLKNDNMPKEFEKLLNTFVKDYGGGLLTLGGKNPDNPSEANAYNREDMAKSQYLRQMLPVNSIDYTPPLGVVVIIDKSGSMTNGTYKGTPLIDLAKAGARACLDALTERDYFGLMTLDTGHEMILNMTPSTQQHTIYSAINSIKGTGMGTLMSPAVRAAGQALRAQTNIDKRHIIVVTDGYIAHTDLDLYEGLISEFNTVDGTTLSVVGVTMEQDGDYSKVTDISQIEKHQNISSYTRMYRATFLGKGKVYPVVGDQLNNIPNLMREDLKVEEIKAVKHELFKPIVTKISSPIMAGVEMQEAPGGQRLTVDLGGFFGAKIKTETEDGKEPEVLLAGEFNVPIYARWKYGEGAVGSFMCDLKGGTDVKTEWSANFLADDNGRLLIQNIVNTLMPTRDIRQSAISVKITEHNYINQMSVYAKLGEGQHIKGEISDGEKTISLNTLTDRQNGANPDVYVTLALDSTNNYSRCNFVVKKTGVYEINLKLLNANDTPVLNSDGTPIEFTSYKSFYYSKEYGSFTQMSNAEASEYMAKLAQEGEGSVIANLEDPVEISEGFIPNIDKVFDPRTLFIIMAIVLFLLDIAVRKFKFKWPHELYRDYKEKKRKSKQS